MQLWQRQLRRLGLLSATGLASIALVLTVPRLTGAEASPDVDWVGQFGSPDHNGATALAVDGSGNLYVGGWTAGTLPLQKFAGGSRDAFVRKFSASGVELWTREFGTPGTDEVTRLAIDPYGDVLVAGMVSGALPGQSAAGSSDVFLRKLTSAGAEVWTRQFGTPLGAGVSGLAVDAAGSAYLSGWVHGNLAGQASSQRNDAFVSKYDTQGHLAWNRQFFGGGDHDRALSMSISTSGASVVAVSNGPRERTHAYARTFTLQGSDVSTVDLGTSTLNDLVAANVDAAGDILVAGSDKHHHTGGFVRKYQADGQQLWSRHVGSTTDSEVVDVSMDAAGNTVFVGQTHGSFAGKTAANQVDLALGILNADGNQVWQGDLRPPRTAAAAAVVLGPNGRIYVAGWLEGSLLGMPVMGLTDAFVVSIRH